MDEALSQSKFNRTLEEDERYCSLDWVLTPDDCIAIIVYVATIIVRRLDESLKTKLRMRAASHGRSMEEEAREILKAGLTAQRAQRLNLAESIRRHIAPIGGVELTLPAREAVRRPPRFAK